MKIAYIITRSDTVGGAQIHVRDLAKAMIHAGHEVNVLVGGKGPYTEQLKAEDITFHSLNHLVHPIHLHHDILGYKEIKTMLKELEPDVVAVHSSKAGVLGRLAAKQLKIPVVFTAHGWAFTEGVPKIKQFLYQHIERYVARFASRIITVSDYDRNLAISRRIASESKIQTIHNGVSDISTNLIAKPEIEPVRIIMVARFEKPKNHSLLLQALKSLQHLSWEVVFVGDGPLMSDVESETRELGLSSRVRFLGRRDDIPELLAHSQIFALISRWEGLPLSILEAMRAGLPVIASDVGGVKEAVVHEKTGYLISREDVTEIREYLNNLITNPQLRKEMGKNGRVQYEKAFTFDQMLKKTLQIYEELASKHL